MLLQKHKQGPRYKKNLEKTFSKLSPTIKLRPKREPTFGFFCNDIFDILECFQVVGSKIPQL